MVRVAAAILRTVAVAVRPTHRIPTRIPVATVSATAGTPLREGRARAREKGEAHNRRRQPSRTKRRKLRSQAKLRAMQKPRRRSCLAGRDATRRHRATVPTVIAQIRVAAVATVAVVVHHVVKRRLN